MAKVNAPLLAFNRGEVSKLALARIDVAKLALAADCQLNWLPFTLGPMMLRPGLGYVGGVLSDALTKMVRFFFATTDTALLELTSGQMRVWINDVLVTRAAVSTTVTSGDFSAATGWDLTTGTTNGCTATITPGQLALQCSAVGGLAQARQVVSVAAPDRGVEHGLRIVVSRGPVTFRAGSTMGASDLIAQTVLDTGTHCLACTPTGATLNIQLESNGNADVVLGADLRQKLITSVTIDAAGALTVPTPWSSSDLANIRYDQSGDIIFVACHGKQQRKIERRSAHGWSVVVYQSNDGPFGTTPTAAVRFVPSNYTGIGTLTCDRPFFQSGHIGALFRLFSPGQAYATPLGAANAFTPAIRVSGVGAARNFNWTVAGAWVGTVTSQVSFDGPDTGWVDVASTGANSTNAINTGGSGGVPPLDNVIAWYRVGFKGGAYASGVAAVSFDFTGGGAPALVRVTGFNSSQSVNVEMISPLSSTDATFDWLEGEWSDVQGWPDSVAFQEGRLWWFGRDRIWGSTPAGYTSFAIEDLTNATLGDAGAIIEAFGSGPVDAVTWALGLTRLLAGRDGSVGSCRASSFDEVMTPTNFSVKDCTTQGAARLPALKLDTRGIFVARGGRKLYELVLSPQAGDYVAHDLTRLNLDIGKPTFTALDIVRQPDTLINLIRGDGQAACLLHDAEDEVEAWWRLQTLGVIEDTCTLPSATGIEDQQYFVVRRIVNGVTRRFIEKLATRDECVGGSLNKQLDSFVTYSGAAATSITLAHLPSTGVMVWADGAFIGSGTTNASGVLTPLPDNTAHSNIVAGLGGVQVIGSSNPLVDGGAGALPDVVFASPQGTLTVGTQYNGYPAEVFADIGATGKLKHVGALTVSGGIVTLPNNAVASIIVAFLGYMAPFQSAKLAYAAQGGTPLTQKKKIDHLGLALFDSHAQGLQFGQRFDRLDPLPLTEEGAAVTTGTVWAEYDEPMIEVPGEWDTDARLCLLAQAPYPCRVGAAVVAVKTHG